MKWFYNLKLGGKLIAAFMTVALIAGLVGAIGIYNLKNMDNEFSGLYENYGASLGDISLVAMSYQRIRVNLRDIVLNKNPEFKQRYVDGVNQNDKIVNENLEKYAKKLNSPEEKKLVNDLKENLAKFKPIRDKIVTLAASGQEDQAYLLIFTGDGRQIAGDIAENIDQIVAYNIKQGQIRSDELSASASRTIYLMAAIAVGAMLAAFGLGMFMSRLIGKPVSEIVAAAEKIADGDLNVNITASGKDEIGVLAQTFRKMSDNMNEVMINISAASEQVAAGAKQISGSSMALSQGATEQASSIEELTASIEEIAVQTRQNAEHASNANQLAETARSNAVKGNGEMQEMLKAMKDINESSGNISKIIKVIDEIAFQTNILALNAAVEAARAGQHGKGFAVVAEEVRNLAARSANAAKETTSMIEGSIKKVEHGTTIANGTAAALNSIVEGVAEVATLVGNIAEASNEQAAGIAQINQGIMQVSQVVQNNSATSEESAAASEELSGQSEVLREMVGRFKLNSNGQVGKINGLNPDVLKVIDGKKSRTVSRSEAVSARTIDLSDRDFGKY
ncbi:methyl-accepting chemotaxis protein [Dendrosporobacter sp. 1207_IL3150]|uniref:methyl-accepting chemotaxis protein n=1 Tax=Dendrosporobacter sp. 1207_IL3150 TaxID=3084054 RepID=UPI002FD951A4